MNKKTIKLTVLINMLFVFFIGCGYAEKEFKSNIAQYDIANKIADKKLYYETDYYDVGKAERVVEFGEINIGETIRIGATHIKLTDENELTYYQVYSLKIYEDKTKEKLIYELNEKTENWLKIFKYIEEENIIIFEMTEDKIIN